MQLYIAPNTIAVAAAITLEESGLAYDTVRVDFASAQQTKPDYLRINPKGRVPALIVDEDILTETGAILEFIAQMAPDAGLVPSDPIAAAKMRMVMFYLASTMHVNHAHKMRGARWADSEDSWADMRAKVPETMTASARYIEEECLAGPFLLGENLTIADAYLFTICTWLKGDGVDTPPFARLNAFIGAMENRASVKAIRDKGLLT